MVLSEETFNIIEDCRNHLIKIIYDQLKNTPDNEVKLAAFCCHPAHSQDGMIVRNHFLRVYLKGDGIFIEYEDDYVDKTFEDPIELFSVDELVEIISGI